MVPNRHAEVKPSPPPGTAPEEAPVHPAGQEERRLLSECEQRRGRRRGPGGQHRNKVETAVVLTHRPSGIQGQASERRSQHQNRQVALFRLRVNLALEWRQPRLAPGEPSPAWRRHCVRGRLAIRDDHHDFPSLLAEALDVLVACDLDLPAAAETLQVSGSQLLRFLRREPRALGWFNTRRRAHNLRPFP